MNKGDYVRTKEGYITKIDSCTCWEAKKQWYISYTLPNGCECASAVNDRFKISPNIIDLIEEDDFINQLRVSEIIKKTKDSIRFMADSDYEFSTELKEKDIKSIVTHEQFSAVEYKVESEVN